MPMIISADLDFNGDEKRLFIIGDNEIALLKKCTTERVDYTIRVSFARDGHFRNVFGEMGFGMVTINEHALAQVDDSTGCVLGIPTKTHVAPDSSSDSPKEE